MIGEDAISSTITTTEKLLQILYEILRMIRQSREQNYGAEKKGINEKLPKIKFGEMKASDYKKMLNEGEKMRTVSVPTDKIEMINDYSKQLGAKYWLLEQDGNNATVVVPEKYYNQFSDALQAAIKEQLSRNESSLCVKNGEELIPEQDIELVRTVLDYHDIPVYTFQNEDGSYMNVVPNEFDGQYKAAMQEIQQLKEQLKNIDIVAFNQTVPFATFDNIINISQEITQEQAEVLSEAVPEAKFAKTENGEIIVKFPRNSENKVTECLENFKKDTALAEDYLVTVVDNTITINKEKLLISEDEKSYFTKIPNTAGKDYIRINKDEAQINDGGKTITAKLDYEKSYKIFDANGNIKAECSGAELAAYYNTKSKNAGKDTKAAHYHNDSLERIELYNSKENKLISIGIESAETIRMDLAEQGFSKQAAEKMLADINKALPEQFKQKFNYNPTETNISYEKISNDYFKEFKLSEKLRDAELMAGFRETEGEKICVFDKENNKYVLASPNETRLREALETMGFDKLKMNAIISQAERSYSHEGAKLERESVPVQSFDTNNAELDGYKYFAGDRGITIVKPQIDDNNASFKYIEIDKNVSRNDIENALGDFGIKDSISKAEMINYFEEKGLIPATGKVAAKDGFTVSRLTSDCALINRNGTEIIVDKNNINTEKICQKFGVTEKQAERLKSGLESAMKNSAARQDGRKSLSEIMASAKKAYEKAKSADKNAPELSTQSERSK